MRGRGGRKGKDTAAAGDTSRGARGSSIAGLQEQVDARPRGISGWAVGVARWLLGGGGTCVMRIEWHWLRGGQRLGCWASAAGAKARRHSAGAEH